MPKARPRPVHGKAVRYVDRLVRKTIDRIEAAALGRFIDELADARRVFMYGAGRSGLVARAFAVRLYHLGYTVYVIGETVAAPVQQGDVVVLVSGTGETYPVAMSAEIARNIGARVLVLTGNPNSKVASFGDVVLHLSPGRTNGRDPALAPLGTIFETATWLLLDGVVAELMRRRHQTEEMMRQRHATME